MKARNRKRQHDGLFIPEGYFAELYTPTVGPVVSPSSGDTLEFVKMILSEDANVTFRNCAGVIVSAFPLAKGPVPFLVKEIHTISAGTVLIVHDGVKASTTQEMNTPIYS